MLIASGINHADLTTSNMLVHKNDQAVVNVLCYRESGQQLEYIQQLR